MKKIIIIALMFLLLLSSFVSAGYDDPDDLTYPESFWDSGKTARITDGVAYVNESDDTSLLCTIASRTITGQPIIINISDEYYTIIYGTNFIEAYDDSCTNIADITLSANLHAPVNAYEWNGWQIFLPLNNDSLEMHTFNGTDFIYNNSRPTTNITNSAGSCADFSGVDYCFWQNITNGLVRYTISTNTITEFDLMNGVKDLTDRSPAVRALSGSDKVIITGEASSNTTNLCVWSAATETIDAGFNSGSCVEVTESSNSGLQSSISNPSVFNIDGGSSLEIAVAYTEVTGSGASFNHITGVDVYGASGTQKYAVTRQHTTGTSTANRDMNVYNPVPVYIDTGASTSAWYFCSFGEVESSVAGNLENAAFICTGQQGDITEVNNNLEPCDNFAGTGSTVCQWVAGTFDNGEAEVNQSGSSVKHTTIIGDSKYITVDQGTGGFTDKGFNFSGTYWSIGDVSSDSVLDFVYNEGTNVFIRLGLFENNEPEYTEYPAVVLNAEDTTLLVNETYTFSTLTVNSYLDADGDLVRFYIECDAINNESHTDTSSYGAAGLDALQGECTWSQTGPYQVRVILQDSYMANAGLTDEDASSDNIRSFNVYVTGNEDLASLPASGSTSDSTSTVSSTTGGNPDDDFASVFGEFGLTGNWLIIIWLFVMLMFGIGLYQVGIRSPMVFAGSQIFMLFIGWFFGAIPTIVITIVGMIIAVIVIGVIFLKDRGG